MPKAIKAQNFNARKKLLLIIVLSGKPNPDSENLGRPTWPLPLWRCVDSSDGTLSKPIKELKIIHKSYLIMPDVMHA